MNDLQTANEQIGSLRTLLHHAEQDKRRLARQLEKTRSQLVDYMDAGDMAVESADFLAESDDDRAIQLRAKIEAWHQRLEAEESEDGRREHAFYGDDDRKPHGSFKQ